MTRLAALFLLSFSALPAAAAVAVPPLPEIPSSAVLRPEAWGSFTQAAGGPAVVVSLPPLLNTHWTSSDAFGVGADRTYLSGHIDLEGTGYMSVLGEGWSEPRFFKIERGMSGRWVIGRSSYSVSLSVSIFRAKLDNYIVVSKDGAGKAYELRISELFAATYKAGTDVAVGGESYRLFYSSNIETEKTGRPAADRENSVLCFIHDEVDGNSHDYKFFLIPFRDVAGKGPVVYKFFNKQKLSLTVPADGSSLEIRP